jgi:hypothetical protein
VSQGRRSHADPAVSAAVARTSEGLELLFKPGTVHKNDGAWAFGTNRKAVDERDFIVIELVRRDVHDLVAAVASTAVIASTTATIITTPTIIATPTT